MFLARSEFPFVPTIPTATILSMITPVGGAQRIPRLTPVHAHACRLYVQPPSGAVLPAEVAQMGDKGMLEVRVGTHTHI